ncbi:FAD-dependent oxidoreductase [Spirosoma oryzicola]|uniref:FAD-dependent oxidoreductase n=1 Tax=Spirosoma oryzicola TaxID=2898794 RepID=UPI001E3CC0E4|nr:NAD(P)/FAD-dependent oxidoreductase [Spirosoma oryzicola]UHG94852.1 FAD-dependent monooxygenase [Spirosoma oryzicola]
MLVKDKQIAIIGGGPGGLTLATLLQKKGVAVTVYERDSDRTKRIQGGTLDLHTESGLAALGKAGLLDAFKASYRPGAEKVRVVNKQAEILDDEHTKSETTHFGDEHHRPEIDRGALRALLLDSLQPDTLVWDSHITSLKSVGKRWKLMFQNGATAIADIVIGADGANSKIRPFVTPIKPFYSGVTIVEGNVYDSATNTPRIHALLKGGKIMALGDSKTITISAKGDGSLDFYAGWKAAANWAKDTGVDFKDRQQVLTLFEGAYEGWDRIWVELFEGASLPLIVRPQYCMPLDQSWEAQSNLTLLGDAAHLMPPYAGEGVNMAMLDALELSECLTSDQFADTQSAIAHYEKQLFNRFARVGRETLDNTDWMHSPEGLEKLVKLFNPAA